MRFTDTWLEYLVTGRNPLWTSSSILMECIGAQAPYVGVKVLRPMMESGAKLEGELGELRQNVDVESSATLKREYDDCL